LKDKNLEIDTSHDEFATHKNENDIANCLRANAALCPTDNTIILGDLNKGGQRGVVYDIESNVMSCLSATDYKQPKQIMESRIRKLTPIEAFRLMDFPDSLVENARKAGVSDSQLYKQAGNSIVVAVLEKIINRLKL
jgi:site-specific DNA-cytosine methylase